MARIPAVLLTLALLWPLAARADVLTFESFPTSNCETTGSTLFGQTCLLYRFDNGMTVTGSPLGTGFYLSGGAGIVVDNGQRELNIFSPFPFDLLSWTGRMGFGAFVPGQPFLLTSSAGGSHLFEPVVGPTTRGAAAAR